MSKLLRNVLYFFSVFILLFIIIKVSDYLNQVNIKTNFKIIWSLCYSFIISLIFLIEKAKLIMQNRNNLKLNAVKFVTLIILVVISLPLNIIAPISIYFYSEKAVLTTYFLIWHTLVSCFELKDVL